MALLRVTVRFLQPFSHGRGDDGSPEWPPSPLRLFQALVAANARRAPAGHASQALHWLEAQPAPEIHAARGTAVAPYRLYVPDNTGDRVAKAWSAGRSADIADYRTEKDVRAIHLDDDAVHYVFRDAVGLEPHVEALRATARSITHVGWGIDLVAGDAGTEPEQLGGERWIPGKASTKRLRCPIAGTFEALEQKHAQFLSRLDDATFRPVSPLTTFDVLPYARDVDPAPRPIAAFRLLDPSAGTRRSFDTPRRSRDVAAWLRHTVSEAAKGWPFGPTGAVVHGHGDSSAVASRFSFLPLPTIGPMGVQDIARVAVAAGPGLDDELAWIRTHIAGGELVWQGRTIALLEPLPASDGVLRRYTASAASWTTVTPVVLPGHDDESPRKSERLLRKAFLQAGFEPAVVDAIEALDWRKVGFLRGTEHARRYALPDKVQGPAYHVAVRFAHPVLGPFAVGSGRHRGIGLFAAV